MLMQWTALLIGRLGFVLFAIFLLCAGALPASSRVWNPTPEKLASDYAIIQDTRPTGDLILLMWFASPIVRPQVPNAAQVRALLDEYIFLSVAHGRFNRTTGSISFDPIDTLEAKDGAGQPLTLVPTSSMPPVTAGVVAIVERLFTQAFGAAGKGMKMFVFDAGDVNACKKGRLSVPFVGETYTWDTPFPGCS
jgi:hypothetical protein